MKFFYYELAFINFDCSQSNCSICNVVMIRGLWYMLILFCHRVEHVYQFFTKWCPSIHNASIDDSDDGCEDDDTAEAVDEEVK